MRFDAEAITRAHAEQEADRLASFRASLHQLDTRALKALAATHRRHLERGTRDVHHRPRLEALTAELAKRED